MSTADTLKLMAGLAFCVERVTEYLVGRPMNQSRRAARYKWLLPYIAAGMGVGLALALELDVVALAGGPHHWLGSVLTGIVIGGGSNVLHAVVVRLGVR